MEERTLNVQGIEIPVYRMNTLIVGSGAASLKCADRLHEMGVENLAIVTERLGAGTSSNSGSDKQTYYKLGVGSAMPDSPWDMAEDLFRGGAMHGDLALVEALGSAECFYHLVSIGVPFPKNRYGGFTGYKTDHDPRQRATSAGPYTSMQMVRSLQREVKRRNIRMFDNHEVIALVVKDGRAMGALALDRGVFDRPASEAGSPAGRTGDPASALVLFMAENTVFGVGGPGGIYERSVYPEKHTGAIGLALEAGAEAVNLTESQYGLASIKFRWNVSGTYQQVIPRYFSTDAKGLDEKEFLNEFFPDMRTLAGAIFLKGYQWPFDPRKIHDHGSSLIDILVYRETALKGRRVFMDFRSNPSGDDRIGKFDITSLEKEAHEYLSNSRALFGTPFERLARMNSMAIDLYRRHGIDLRSEPLEIAVCAQHNNGGLSADLWWESVNLAHFFPIGEVNGTHGVYRPGGSALNSGQVGAQRAAEKIANVYVKETFDPGAFEAEAERTAAALMTLMRSFVSEDGDDRRAEREREELQRRMTLHGAHIRDPEGVRKAVEEAKRQTLSFRHVTVKSTELLPHLLRTRHLLIAHTAYLSAVASYLENGGGSRGSYLVMTGDGERVHGGLEEMWRYRPENPALRESLLVTRSTGDPSGAGEFRSEFVPRRPIPEDEFWFENVWNEYLKKSIYHPEGRQS